MNNRLQIPRPIETEVLTKCLRRCCICYGLKGDLSERAGQIAHLDKDPSNNDPDNLAYLCLDHHDRYDGRTSQSKGLTMDEVKQYRSRLWDAIDRNLHVQASKLTSGDPRVRKILEWKDKLVSVRRPMLFEGSMERGWVPHNQRDYRLVDCDETVVHFDDTASGEHLAVPFEDVKVSRDTTKHRLLLILEENPSVG